MIEMSQVGLRYPDGTRALSGVDLAIGPGSLRFVTGRSGAGKTSLLRLLYLAVRPGSGRLTLFDQDASRLSRHGVALARRRIGVVPQDIRLIDHLTVFENVALPLMAAGRREAEYRSNVGEMLEWVKLSHRLKARPAQLSGGEKQCVAIARAMVSVPELILADEPTGGVDEDMGGRIMALFQEMIRLDRTVLIATHDTELARRSGAPRLHLEGGRLRELAPGAPEPAAEAAS